MHREKLVDDYPDGRSETDTERHDRNWNELMQELRVTQTGTQILAGFLLAIAFQPRFPSLDQLQIGVYISLILLAVLATILGLTPVALHRRLFQRRAKGPLVEVSSVIVFAMLVSVGLLFIGVAMFITDVVIGRPASFFAGGGVLLIIIAVWTILPAGVRRSLRKERATRVRSAQRDHADGSGA